MMDLYFFVKTFILTVALVVLLQLKIGSHSLEEQATMLFRGSLIATPLNAIAQGGAQFTRDMISGIQEKIDGPKKNQPKEASKAKASGFKFSWD
jgi:hypothetical protein